MNTYTGFKIIGGPMPPNILQYHHNTWVAVVQQATKIFWPKITLKPLISNDSNAESISYKPNEQKNKTSRRKQQLDYSRRQQPDNCHTSERDSLWRQIGGHVESPQFKTVEFVGVKIIPLHLLNPPFLYNKEKWCSYIICSDKFFWNRKKIYSKIIQALPTPRGRW